MRVSIIFFALLSFCSQALFAQKGEKPLSDAKKKELAEALMESGSYYNANDLFQELYQDKPTPALAWQIADAFFKSRDYPAAVTWYKKVWDESPGAYPDAQYYYALCLKLNGRYDEALREFEEFRKSTAVRGAEAAEMKRRAKNEAKGCELAKLIVAEPLEMEISPMGSNINAAYTEFSPFPVNDDELIYASLRTDSVVIMGANKKSTMRSKFYTSRRSGDVWSEGREYDNALNDLQGHVGNGSLSEDGKRMYFTVCNPAEDVSKMICEVYMAEYANNGWSKSKKVSEISESGYTATHPALATLKGKEYLYFVSDRPGGRGGMDLWYAEVTGDGKNHSEARNCGPKINTDGDEVTPFWSAKEQLLFFSSNGHINIGGLDVFKIEGREKTWKTPLNAGYPINSNVDDFYFVTAQNGETGFLVSNREGSISLKNAFCCDDIFSFEYIFPPQFTIMGQVYVKGAAKPTPIEGAFVQLSRTEQPRMDSTVSATQVPYDFFLGTLQDNFELRANKAGYSGDRATTSTKGLLTSDTLYVDLYLEPIDTTRSITIKDIYYELDKADLRPESKKGLDSLYAILMAYPTIQIEISSHTDSRGSNPYNVDLSQRRAESVVRYLVSSKQVPTNRLVARGYGETKLLNKCPDGANCSEEEHQINRRTEFRILGQVPGTTVNYDKATIDAMRALERERGGLDERIKQLMEQGEYGAIDEQVGSGEINREVVPGENPAPTPGAPTGNAPVVPVAPAAPVGPTAAALSPALEVKGTVIFGQALVNEVEQVQYMFDARRPVVFMGPNLFSKLNAAGTITEFKNSTVVTLPDGTTAQGDIFVLKTLQLGANVLQNIEVKLNPRMPQDLVVGQKLLDDNNCKIDLKKNQLICK